VSPPLAIVFPPPLTPLLLIGLETLVVAVVLWAAGPGIERRWSAWRRLGRPMGILLGLAGLGLSVIAVLSEQTPSSELVNPLPRTVETVAAGAGSYSANCARCHGVDARGGGPDAATTQIPPTNLVSGHLDGHSDGDIFYWVSNGLPGGMPAWAGRLSEGERWQLVTYLRDLNDRTP
jgi:mono/diheme cytochrome c family protein